MTLWPTASSGPRPGDEARRSSFADGNNVEEGRKILAEANHPLVTLADNMDSGADKAAELAAK